MCSVVYTHYLVLFICAFNGCSNNNVYVVFYLRSIKYICCTMTIDQTFRKIYCFLLLTISHQIDQFFFLAFCIIVVYTLITMICVVFAGGLYRLRELFDFFVNVFTELGKFSDKNYIILKRGFLHSNLLSLV